MDLSRICIACGMCCQGVLYTEARLEAGEREVMVHIGGRPTADGTAFSLPCPVHDGDRCGSYELRPNVCHEFECAVLMSVRQGERTTDEALGLVESLKQKVAEAEEIVGGVETGLPLNERMARFLEQTPRHDPLFNQVTLKSIVLDIERSTFENRGYRDPRAVDAVTSRSVRP